MKTQHLIAVILLSFILASCSGTGNNDFVSASNPAYPNVTAPKPQPPKKTISPNSCFAENGTVGRPYTIRGVRYTPAKNPDYVRTGIASYYGKQHHGKQTANGERFNMNGLSAAHKTLPLPSCVKVTNLKNNKSIVLRVNDRGPFIKGRIIDVSYAAAKELDFIGTGITKVRVEAVN